MYLLMLPLWESASVQAPYVLRFKGHCNTAIAMKNKYRNIHRIAFEVGIVNLLCVSKLNHYLAAWVLCVISLEQ